MREEGAFDATALSAGWRVLRRHLRYARADSTKLLWIVRRVWQILRRGELRGVLQRHRIVGELYRDYPAWAAIVDRGDESRRAELTAASAHWRIRPRVSVLMPVHAPALPFLEPAIESVLRQSYPEWELVVVDDKSPEVAHLEWLERIASREPRIRIRRRGANGGIAVATNDALAAATGDFCLFMDQDDALSADALFEIAARAVERPHVVMIYADEDVIDAAGARTRPMFKPQWDPEWLRVTNYVLHPTAIRTDVLRRLDGLRTGLDGVQDWDLLLRVSEHCAADSIAHIPRVLYHWREHRGSTAAGIYEKRGIVAAQEAAMRDSIRRRDEDATAERVGDKWRLKYRLPPTPPLVSIVIPTRDREDLLRMCIDGLRARTRYPNWEAIVVDNGSTDAAALAFIATLSADRRFTILRDHSPFNYPALCNRGVTASRGEIILLLNNDVDPVAPDWLDELVSHAVRPEVGLVGPILYYPDETIQHAGVVLGLNGTADRPYIGYPRGFAGADNRLASVHVVTAMITACAAVRRSIYDAAGGMDEALPVACNDLDLCLRVAELGYRNLITPYAELWHLESATRGYSYANAVSAQALADEARFREKWPAIGVDRTYNPNFSLRGRAYSLRDPESTARG